MFEVQGKPGYVMLMALTAVLLTVTVFFHAFQQGFVQDGRGQDIGLFKNNLSYLTDKYALEITPAPWTFSIWIFIYLFQIAWLCYAFTLLNRRNESHTGMLYYDPPFLSPEFYAIYSMGLILTVLWVYSWDSEFIVAGRFALTGVELCLDICQYFSFKSLWKYERELSKRDMWLNIVLVQNGMGVYSSWVFIVTQLHFGILLHYHHHVAHDTACFVSLAVLVALWLMWSLIDMLVTAKCHTRYFFAPYVVIIVAFSGILDRNWDPDSKVQMFAVSILALAIVFLMFKIISVLHYRVTLPLDIERRGRIVQLL